MLSRACCCSGGPMRLLMQLARPSANCPCRSSPSCVVAYRIHGCASQVCIMVVQMTLLQQFSHMPSRSCAGWCGHLPLARQQVLQRSLVDGQVEQLRQCAPQVGQLRLIGLVHTSVLPLGSALALRLARRAELLRRLPCIVCKLHGLLLLRWWRRCTLLLPRLVFRWPTYVWWCRACCLWRSTSCFLQTHAGWFQGSSTT